MRKVHILLLAVLIFPLVAAAQGPAGAGSGSRSRSGSGSMSGSGDTQWQLAVGYQYLRVNLNGGPFNTEGVNTTITRFFGRWFGVDAQMGAGFFGNTGTSSVPPNLATHTFFAGGGPRLAYRGPSRFQPWAHFVIGVQDFRFTQTANSIFGNNRALGGAAGGGLDIPLTEHFAFRAEADELGTRLFMTNQRHFQVVSGLVINF